jgi:phosphoglycerate dehydrogenase-like enzyme
MSERQVLIPHMAHDRIRSRLDDLPHDLAILRWSPTGVTWADGSPVPANRYAPEVGWIAIDTMFSGDFPSFAATMLEPGTVRWVQSCLAGIDAPPLLKILEAGIRLSNSDSPNAGVAEYVLAAVMHVQHDWTGRRDNQRKAKWAQSGWSEINGTRWLVVGFGSVGGEIAKRARSFGVEVVGARRTKVRDARADAMITMDRIGEVLPSANVVVLACPLTDETRGLVNEEFLSQMREDAILVNVARGAVVDTAQLLEALSSDRPGHAILDVFETEPLDPSSPLWDHPGVTLTSHIAGAGSGITKRGDEVFLEQLDAYLAGRPLRLEV